LKQLLFLIFVMMEIKVPSALTQEAERKQIARYFLCRTQQLTTCYVTQTYITLETFIDLKNGFRERVKHESYYNII